MSAQTWIFAWGQSTQWGKYFAFIYCRLSKGCDLIHPCLTCRSTNGPTVVTRKKIRRDTFGSCALTSTKQIALLLLPRALAARRLHFSVILFSLLGMSCLFRTSSVAHSACHMINFYLKVAKIPHYSAWPLWSSCFFFTPQSHFAANEKQNFNPT